jgi:DNA recombination protein RmuC
MHEFAAEFAALLPSFLPPSLLLLLLLGATVAFGVLLLATIIHSLHQRRCRRHAEHKLLLAERRCREQEIRAAKLITLLKNDRKHGVEKLRLLEDARDEITLRFAQLAQQSLEEKSLALSDLNRDKLGAILEPLHRQLGFFKQELNELARVDSRERQSLKTEILQLRDLNQQLSREALNLTRALKSDNKLQGNWGELVLNRVLERSGLRLGHEYHTQESYRDDSQRLQRPDVIIHLPEGRDIIVDAKVSLVAWERLVNCDEEDERAEHLKQLIRAIRDHVTGLAAKNYPRLSEVTSLDFVLMFLPIEAAFATVAQADDALITDALAAGVIIVTPTTLLATLKTIENLWKYERQTRNAEEIARRAGQMYDKFCLFTLELEKLGKQLATCSATYDAALAKLSQGRGNLISQAEQLRELGVHAKKELPKTMSNGGEKPQSCDNAAQDDCQAPANMVVETDVLDPGGNPMGGDRNHPLTP